MVRIIICDDNRKFLNRLCTDMESALDALNAKAKVYPYTQMESIPDSILNGCDIAFLDIDFEGKRYNGIDIARKIRAVRKDAVIIFVTNYIEYAPEGYEVNAFRYVLKSDIQKKLPVYLPEALAQLQSCGETMTIQINSEWFDIPLAEIRYIESQKHTVIVHTPRKDYAYYSSLTTLEEQLESKGFLRIHKSYLVNMSHLKRYQSQGAVLIDGTCLRVSEKSYSMQKKKYLFWKGL